jgi:hypothetical protein
LEELMPIIFFVIIIIAFIGIGIGFAIWSSQMKDKRRKEMAGWAQANGLKFLPEKDHSIWMRYQLFKCLQRGEDRYAYKPIITTSLPWWLMPASRSSRSSSAPRGSSIR